MIRRFPIDPRRPWPVGETIRRGIPRVNGLPLVHILHVREQQLRTVSHKDALNEGFQGNRARMAFHLDWVRRHDKTWCRLHRLASDAQLMERWRTRHANRTVLVVTLELVRIERERFLAHQRPISGHTIGGNGQYAQVSSEVDRLPVAALNEDEVREARHAGAAARAGHAQARQAETGQARAARNMERGRLRGQRERD